MELPHAQHRWWLSHLNFLLILIKNTLVFKKFFEINDDYFFPGDLGRSAIEGVATVPVGGERPEVGIILFNMGSVNKHLYSNIANIKLEVTF